MKSLGKRTRIGVACLLLTSLPAQALAEYTDSCSRYAKRLWNAADQYENEKSSYESACNPSYGYSKDNTGACGSYGYLRSSYESAKSELQDAIGSVRKMCGVPAQDSVYIQLLRNMKLEMDDLQKKLDATKAELESTKAKLEESKKK